MRIPPIIYGVLVLLVFLGTIFGFQAAGVWSISGKITASGEAVQPSAEDVNTIKGWMTLEQVSSTYAVPLEELLTQFDLPPDTSPSTAIKDLESDLFSVTNLRDWLTSRNSEEPAPSPDAAGELAVQEAAWTPAAAPQAPTATPLPVDHVPADKTITGKTTFGELLDWGVPEESIAEILGGAVPAPAVVIKDYVTQKGIAFSEVKASLQLEVDRTK